MLGLTEDELVRLVTVTVLRPTTLSHSSSLPSTHLTAQTCGGRRGGAGVGRHHGGHHGGGGGGGGGATVEHLSLALVAVEGETRLVAGTVELAGTTGSRVASSGRADTEGGGAAVASQVPGLGGLTQGRAVQPVRRHQAGGCLRDGRGGGGRTDLLAAVKHLPVTLLTVEVQTASVLWAEVLASCTGRLLEVLGAVTVGGGAAVSSQLTLRHILAQCLALQGRRTGEAGAGTCQPQHH